MPKPIDPGEFRTPLVLQAATVTKDGVGQPHESWENVGVVWARVSPLNARETFWAQQTHATTTHNITCRYDARITPTSRFVMDGSRILNADGVRDEDSRRIYMTISCTEQSTSE